MVFDKQQEKKKEFVFLNQYQAIVHFLYIWTYQKFRDFSIFSEGIEKERCAEES